MMTETQCLLCTFTTFLNICAKFQHCSRLIQVLKLTIQVTNDIDEPMTYPTTPSQHCSGPS